VGGRTDVEQEVSAAGDCAHEQSDEFLGTGVVLSALGAVEPVGTANATALLPRVSGPEPVDVLVLCAEDVAVSPRHTAVDAVIDDDLVAVGRLSIEPGEHSAGVRVVLIEIPLSAVGVDH